MSGRPRPSNEIRADIDALNRDLGDFYDELRTAQDYETGWGAGDCVRIFRKKPYRDGMAGHPALSPRRSPVKPASEIIRVGNVIYDHTGQINRVSGERWLRTERWGQRMLYYSFDWDFSKTESVECAP